MLHHRLPKLIALLTVLVLSGCATQQPRYGHDGVYYEQPGFHHSSAHVRVAGPTLYPYWSLDYFYFSRYYHPYSVIFHAYDPWYYPYPGWYYGYRPGPRTRLSLSLGHYYPWHGFGGWYHTYQPWRPQYVSYPRHHHPASGQPRVRQLDERLREAERRQRTVAARQQPDRDPAGAGWTGSSIGSGRPPNRRASEQGVTERRGIERRSERTRTQHEPFMPRQERSVRPPPAGTIRSREQRPVERRQPPVGDRRPSPPPATTAPARQPSVPPNRTREPTPRQSAPQPQRDRDSSQPRREPSRQRQL